MQPELDPFGDLTAAYANADVIPGGAEYPSRWAEQAAAFRTGLGDRARTGLRWGEGARQTFDLFLPEGAPRGLAVFLHGGYWLAFDPSSWSHLAAGALAHRRSWAAPRPCGSPSSSTAPSSRA